MRWILALLLVSLAIWSCDEVESPQSRIVLLEAPDRLSFLYYYWDPQPYETTSVRFVVSLDPPVADVESVQCRVLVGDHNGTLVDSFTLYDDGGTIQRIGSECEAPYSGDHEANNGNFTRVIRPWVFAPNYPGVPVWFRFYVAHRESDFQLVEHAAATWRPYFTLDYTATPPDFFTYCDDSAVFELHLTRDPTDEIERVRIGYSNYAWFESEYPCVPTSGDSIWRGAVPSSDDGWYNSSGNRIAVWAQTRLGYSEMVWLEYSFQPDPPSVDLSHTVDTLRIQNSAAAETLYVVSQALACPTRGIVGNAATFPWTTMPTFPFWTSRLDYEFLDCGTDGDAVEGDGLATARYLVFASNTATPQDLTIVTMSGISHYVSCSFIDDDGLMHARFDTVRVFVIPPQ